MEQGGQGDGAHAGSGHGAPILEARRVYKTYRLGRVQVPVLRGAGLRVSPGECVAVLGASGSGKSTLLHLLGGLDRPDKRVLTAEHERADGGEIRFEDRSLSAFSARELDQYRNRSVGFVFQFYHLLPELNVLQNTMLGAMIGRGRLAWYRQSRPLRGRASELLDRFGLGARLRHRPAELSGGERQRVAIARALMNQPRVLLADEPTGNLDQATGATIMDVLMSLRDELGQTLVIVTHDERTAARADRIVHLQDGCVMQEGEDRSVATD